MSGEEAIEFSFQEQSAKRPFTVLYEPRSLGNSLKKRKRWVASYSLPVTQTAQNDHNSKLWLSKNEIPPISSALGRLDAQEISDFSKKLDDQATKLRSLVTASNLKNEPISPESRNSSYMTPFGGVTPLTPLSESRKRRLSDEFEPDLPKNNRKCIKLDEKSKISDGIVHVKHNYDELYVAKTLAEFAVVKKPSRQLGPAISFEDIRKRNQPIWRIPLNQIDDTTPQPNKFLLGRSILQPALTLFPFSTISILVSALWNDSNSMFENYISLLSFLRNCDTPDRDLIPDGFYYRCQAGLDSENMKNSTDVFRQQFESLQEFSEVL